MDKTIKSRNDTIKRDMFRGGKGEGKIKQKNKYPEFFEALKKE